MLGVSVMTPVRASRCWSRNFDDDTDFNTPSLTIAASTFCPPGGPVLMR